MLWPLRYSADVLPPTVATRLPGRSSGPWISLRSDCTVSEDVTLAVKNAMNTTAVNIQSTETTRAAALLGIDSAWVARVDVAQKMASKMPGKYDRFSSRP